MRVIAGDAGGLRLKSGKGTKARPTTDMVKEALFNTLGSVVDVKFLDLFAGFGGVGIEALSRGASFAVFVEKDPEHIGIIKENLASTRLAEQAKVVRGDVLKALATLEAGFDIIYVDPPYESGLYEKVLEIIQSRGLVKQDGIIVLEYAKDLPPTVPDVYELLKYKSYGETGLSFLRLKG